MRARRMRGGGGVVLPPGPPRDNEATVGALWIANATGAAGSGYGGSEPDPAATIAARLAGSKPMPTLNFLGFPDEVFTDTHIWLPFQMELQDSRYASAGLGRPVPCVLKWYCEGNTGFVTERTQKVWIDKLGKTRELTAYWVKLLRPDLHLGPGGAGQRGSEIRFYAEAIPDDLVNYASRLIGAGPFFPRDASGVVKKTVHKAGSGDYTTIISVVNLAVSEFAASGKAVIGEIIDSGKDWATGLRAANTTVPWNTCITVGLDFTTGLPVTATLGDKTSFPAAGTSAQGLNKTLFDGFLHDSGGTGGVGPRTGTDTVHWRDCEHFSSGAPASATVNSIFYAEYGTGSGQASLIRGRQAGPAVIAPAGVGKTVSWCTDYHDLPSYALNKAATIVNATIRNISGSPVQDCFGGVYGLRISKFGGYSGSGLTSLPGDSAPGMLLTVSDGAYWDVARTGVVGGPGQYLQFRTGVDAASAVLVEQVLLTQNVPVSSIVATINSNSTTLAAVTATDEIGDIKLDCTFLHVEGRATTTPLARAQIPNIGGLDMIVAMDIHASGFAYTVAAGDYRMNLSIVNCRWTEYCGAASTSGSTNASASGDEITYWDIYYRDCAWFDERGYLNRHDVWQEIGIELGYMNGAKDGFGFYGCTWAANPGNASSGIVFTDVPMRTMRNGVVGYCYGQVGNYPTGVCVIGLVSPYQSLPTGPIATINSKFIGTTGVAKPANDVFMDAANGDFTLLDTTFAQTPDGLSWAGVYAGPGDVKQAA